MDMIKLMEQYSITLRRIPKEKISYIWKNNQWVKEIHPQKEGWIAKIDKSDGSIQKWDIKKQYATTDFWGETAEEAMSKAEEMAKIYEEKAKLPRKPLKTL